MGGELGFEERSLLDGFERLEGEEVGNRWRREKAMRGEEDGRDKVKVMESACAGGQSGAVDRRGRCRELGGVRRGNHLLRA